MFIFNDILLLWNNEMAFFYVCVLKTHVILTFNFKNTKGQLWCALIADQTQMSTNKSDLICIIP